MLDLAFFEAESEHLIIRDDETRPLFQIPSRAHALDSKASNLGRASKGGRPEPLGNTERYQESQRLE
jgi:hypothetical protein